MLCTERTPERAQGEGASASREPCPHPDLTSSLQRETETEKERLRERGRDIRRESMAEKAGMFLWESRVTEGGGGWGWAVTIPSLVWIK